MDVLEIREKVTSVFREVFADPNIVLSDEMTANDVDKWDSLTNMAMISAIEQEFNIKFKLKDLNKLKNVGNLIATINSKL